MLNKSGGDPAARHFSPQNQRARQSKISELKLEKHPASSELVAEGGQHRVPGNSNSFHFGSAYQPTDRINTKN